MWNKDLHMQSLQNWPFKKINGKSNETLIYLFVFNLEINSNPKFSAQNLLQFSLNLCEAPPPLSCEGLGSSNKGRRRSAQTFLHLCSAEPAHLAAIGCLCVYSAPTFTSTPEKSVPFSPRVPWKRLMDVTYCFVFFPLESQNPLWVTLLSVLLALLRGSALSKKILPAGQRWAVPMRGTPATIRPRQGVRCQSWCLEWDTASGPTPSVLLGTPKWRASRAPPAPAARAAGRASRGSGGPWTRSWCGRRMSANDWRSKTRTCTTRSWAKCWVSQIKLPFDRPHAASHELLHNSFHCFWI